MNETVFNELAEWVTQAGLIGRTESELMAGFCQTSYLTESQCAVEEADGLIMEMIFHPPTVQLGLVQSESLFRDVAHAPFAIGQNVKAHGQQIPKQFGCGWRIVISP